jgi:hypothetical protein
VPLGHLGLSVELMSEIKGQALGSLPLSQGVGDELNLQGILFSWIGKRIAAFEKDPNCRPPDIAVL